MISVKAKKLFFISPHLDDAALSAGALISSLSGKSDMTLLNVFTKPSTASPSFSVKKMLSACGVRDSIALFNIRLEEDKEAFKGIKIKITNLDYIDALWRQKASWLSKYIPEAGYIYPVFSLFAKSGKISPKDSPIVADLKRDLIREVKDPNNSLVFCPLGLGKHVDHLIVKKAVTDLFPNVIYWSDYPYNLEERVDQKPAFVFKNNLSKKQKMISCCKSQLDLLFKSKKISNLAERYYEK